VVPPTTAPEPVPTSPARAGAVAPPRAQLRVLATLNEDGSRRYVRPKPSAGGWLTRRRVVAYLLMLVFIGLPHVRIAGKPGIRLDLVAREFTFFGTTFYPTDTILFWLLFLGAFIAVFYFTALYGRIWCGWACPQTVFLEHLYRPIEYLFEGGRGGTLAIDRGQAPRWRRIAKWGVYLGISALLAHTFLAYYVGTETLAQWMRQDPREHWTPFLIMAFATGALFFNFTWFREQTCLVVCPYGRIQSVMLDRDSLIVGYDAARGEPRGKPRGRVDAAVAATSGARGDCIDCGACVQTCPTGIDIRDGLQMECIHCTQCADACDAIMARVGSAPGLVRYTSRRELDGGRTRFLRPRTIIYPTALAVVLTAFTYLLTTKVDAEVTVLRGAGEPFTLDAASGRVINQVRVRIRNSAGEARRYTISLPALPEAQLIAPMNPLTVGPGALQETSLFVLVPVSALPGGARDVLVRVTDGVDVTIEKPYQLVGPAPAPAAP
jgi:cytochrome c oxidase accessory protein FixG